MLPYFLAMLLKLKLYIYIFNLETAVCVCVCVYSTAQLCPTCCSLMESSFSMAPLSMEFSRQEYQSRLPFPTLWYLRDPGIETTSLVSPALAGRFFTTSAAGET